MTIIDSNQGNVKQSEVGVDQSLPLLQTGANEDSMTALNQTVNVLTNALRRLSMFLLSDGVITWNGSNIGNSGSNILLKINQRASGQVLTITIPTAYASTFTLVSGDTLVLQITRTALEGANFTLPQSYAQLVVLPESAMPALQSPQSPTADDPTAYIPILASYNNIGNNAAYWPLHGIYWPQNTSSPLGAVLTSAVAPIGTVVDYFPMSNIASSPPNIYGYSSTKAVAPGYQLCNGAIVTDAASPFANPTRNADGTPNGGTNFNLDTYTPNLNGAAQIYQAGYNYNTGDYVQSSGLYYVSLQTPNTGHTPASSPTYWAVESNGTTGFNDLLTTNPNNRYRWTTTNQGKNTFIRGNTQTFPAQSASTYGGAASNTFTPNLGSHVHYMLAHTHGSSAMIVAAQINPAQTAQFIVGVSRNPGGPQAWGGYRYTGGYLGTGGTYTGGLPVLNPTDGPSVNNTDVPSSQSGTNTVPTVPPYANVLKLIRIY